MDVLNNHVTIRKFKNQDVPDEMINSILYSGIRASTTGNMQLYSVIINRSGEIKNKLVHFHFNQAVAAGAPVLLTFVADFNRFSRWCLLRKALPGYNNLLSFFNAFIDTLLVAQNVCVASENAGLGICYLGTTIYNAGEIIELLQLPSLTFPVTAVALGWPDEHPEQADRIPLKGIMHTESYKLYTDDILNDLYKEKELLSSSLKFVAENAKETLAQVFTDVRYKKSDNVVYSEKLLSALQKQGFLVQTENSKL